LEFYSRIWPPQHLDTRHKYYTTFAANEFL
jgi:hypothetical protein